MTAATLPAPAGALPADDGARRRLALRRWLDVATWLLLLVVAAPPVLSSAKNLYELGHRQLALPGHWALLVPLSVDAAALLCVFLTLRAVHAGQSAGLARGLVVAFAGISAWLGYQEAALIGTQAARVFYPVMPVAAALLLDMVIRHRRRDALERLGALEPALPRFRLLRWLVAFTETRRAWAAGVRHGITDPAACLAFVREVDALQDLGDVDAARYAFRATDSADQAAARAWLAARGVHLAQAALDTATPAHMHQQPAQSPVPAPTDAGGDQEQPVEATPPAAGSTLDVAAMTKRDALRVAFTELGCWDVPAALRWLSDRGVTADRSDARRIAKAQQSERAQLVPIAGGARR